MGYEAEEKLRLGVCVQKLLNTIVLTVSARCLYEYCNFKITLSLFGENEFQERILLTNFRHVINSKAILQLSLT
jgi:hypothetical protein